MIESGTHTPGISAADFDLPPHTALRYERAAPALRDFVPSYVVLDSEPVDPPMTSEWMLPGWAQIWIVMTSGPITVEIGNRRYDPLPLAVLYGVTSRAMPVTAQGGVTIGIDVTPLGWARLFAHSADALRDRVTPLQQVMSGPMVDELVASLYASDRALEVKDVLDAFFLRHIGNAHRDEQVIAQIAALIADPAADVDAAIATLGISPHKLRRVTKRYFGFPPKTLMMRTRFLQALVAMLAAGSAADHGAVPAGYHDRSHFLRDAQRFLGMTARQFLALDTPYLDAALRARLLVMGAATPSLDRMPGSR